MGAINVWEVESLERSSRRPEVAAPRRGSRRGTETSQAARVSFRRRRPTGFCDLTWFPRFIGEGEAPASSPLPGSRIEGK